MLTKFLRHVAAGITLFFLMAPSVFAQTNLTGFWAFRIKNAGVYYYELQQNGETITGKSAEWSVRQLKGTLRNGNLHLELTFQGKTPWWMSKVTNFDGVVSGDKFVLTMQGEGREPVQGTWERVTREEIFPPREPLPLPRSLPDNGLARTPPMGWNTWNKFFDTYDETLVREMADTMVSSGMSKAGYVYLIMDCGWSSEHDAQGNIMPNGKFPHFKELIDYIHSKGLKVGLYSSPGPEAAGITRGAYSGSYGHEEQDAKTFAAWGADYVKYDWSSASRIYKNTREDMQGAYQKIGEALEKSGRPIVFSICQYGIADVWKWGADAGGNLWRTTDDINDSWSSIEHIGFAQPDFATFAKPGHWNDPDMLEVGNGGMTVDEYRTHMSLWCLAAAPLMAGNDLRHMTNETKSILMNPEVIAIDQDPNYKPMQRIAREGKTEVIARWLGDGSMAVGLFNRGDQPATVEVPWEKVGGKPARVRDLWTHRDVSLANGPFRPVVPVHGVVLLKVVPAAGHRP
jgi:alpha-galactosidase